MVKIDYFESIEELRNSIYRTKWEAKNNIDISSTEILESLSNEDVKVIKVNKSNGEIGIVLGLKISREDGGWQKVYVYETVIKQFPTIYQYYKEIDESNRKIWRKRYENNTD